MSEQEQPTLEIPDNGPTLKTPEPTSTPEAGPAMSKPKPVTLDMVVELHTFCKGDKIVIARRAVGADNIVDFSIKFTATAHGGRVQAEVTRFIPDCFNLDDAFARWDETKEAGLEDLKRRTAPGLSVASARDIPPAFGGLGGNRGHHPFGPGRR